MRTEEGKLYLFVDIDRTSKFVYVELLEQYGKMEAAQFLRNLIAAVPYRLHTVLTERSVSKAAMRLGMHQPAVSGALRRLRELSGDALLVRSGSGMVRSFMGSFCLE